MSDTLTQLIAKTQAMLGDDGTIFTTALVTAATRQALTEFNRVSPVHAAVLITGVNDQYEYELTDADSLSVKILDVLKQGDNADELDIPLTYDDYIEDERIFFRLRSPVTTSDTLIVRYTLNHTINGLDSATESTPLAKDDQILVDGACYHAVMIRAASRVETINLSKDQSDNYREVAGHFRQAFNLGLANLGRTRRSPVSEPDTRAWNDQYHSWGQ
jgi:hypothetical protein